jgi:hypothetical protein
MNIQNQNDPTVVDPTLVQIQDVVQPPTQVETQPAIQPQLPPPPVSTVAIEKEKVSTVSPKIYRAHRDVVYDQLTEKNVEDYGFKFDSDLFVYNDAMNQLTSIVLNRYLFVTSDSFKEYEYVDGEQVLTQSCVNKLNDWLRLWGKIPGFLEVRAVPKKGFGVFSKQKILRGVFLGYYDGIRNPFPNINPKNPYYFTVCNDKNEPVGSIDGQNLTFGNFVSLINDGNPERYNVGFMSHNMQIMAVTTKNIDVGEELIGPYGDQYWNSQNKKKLD